MRAQTGMTKLGASGDDFSMLILRSLIRSQSTGAGFRTMVV